MLHVFMFHAGQLPELLACDKQIANFSLLSASCMHVTNKWTLSHFCLHVGDRENTMCYKPGRISLVLGTAFLVLLIVLIIRLLLLIVFGWATSSPFLARFLLTPVDSTLQPFQVHLGHFDPHRFCSDPVEQHLEFVPLDRRW